MSVIPAVVDFTITNSVMLFQELKGGEKRHKQVRVLVIKCPSKLSAVHYFSTQLMCRMHWRLQLEETRKQACTSFCDWRFRAVFSPSVPKAGIVIRSRQRLLSFLPQTHISLHLIGIKSRNTHFHTILTAQLRYWCYIIYTFCIKFISTKEPIDCLKYYLN